MTTKLKKKKIPGRNLEQSLPKWKEDRGNFWI